jgi:YHS domain-containing protein
MKKSMKFIPLFALLIIGIIAVGYIYTNNEGVLKKVESEYVCMINNRLFDKPQIPVSVNGKTYYGCCPMCKAKLEGSEQARLSTDPVSSKQVDKATAVIGADGEGKVYYFENESNLKKFAN